MLSAVAGLCGEGLEPCNREVCGRVGIADQSQVSRLMMGLQAQGLVENTRTGVVGTRKAWRVTPQGQAVLDANPPLEREHHARRKSASVEGIAVSGRASARVGVGVSRRWGGAGSVSESQRARLLEAAFALVAQEGYRGLTVAKLAGRSRLPSPNTAPCTRQGTRFNPVYG